MNKRDETSDWLRSLRRSTTLLRLLSMRPNTGWRLTDLAQASDLHHSTVHRLIGVLVQERLAMRSPGTLRYTLGPTAYELGLAVQSQFSVPDEVAARLSSLAARTRDIVFFSVRSGADSVCIGRWEGRRALKAYTVNVGTRRPMSLSAGGVAMLIELAPEDRDAVVRTNLEGIARRGEAQVAAVRRMVTRSLRLGYGLNQEDIIPGIAAVGVAFGSVVGRPAAAISLAADALELVDAKRERIVERLRQEAALLTDLFAASRYMAAA